MKTDTSYTCTHSATCFTCDIQLTARCSANEKKENEQKKLERERENPRRCHWFRWQCISFRFIVDTVDSSQMKALWSSLPSPLYNSRYELVAAQTRRYARDGFTKYRKLFRRRYDDDRAAHSLRYYYYVPYGATCMQCISHNLRWFDRRTVVTACDTNPTVSHLHRHHKSVMRKLFDCLILFFVCA